MSRHQIDANNQLSQSPVGWWGGSTRSDALTIQSFKLWSARSPLIGECTEAVKAQKHARVRSLVLPHHLTQHVQSNYRERTRPGPCAPSDLVPGQIDEALYRPSRSNHSFLALITETKGRSASARLSCVQHANTLYQRSSYFSCRSLINMNKVTEPFKQIFQELPSAKRGHSCVKGAENNWIRCC